jgi:hypothetical protein
MGDPTSSYATAGIVLRVSGALKPHHHHKVETPSVGARIIIYDISVLLVEPSGATSQQREVTEWCILFRQQLIFITPTHWQEQLENNRSIASSKIR